jgi:antitoxin FitA
MFAMSARIERRANEEVCMYCACMPHIQVRDVPDNVHQILATRAERAGQSMQQYLAAQLAALASTPTVDEVVERIGRRRKGSVTARDAVAAIHAERARR